jgi:hypothetical protein
MKLCFTCEEHMLSVFEIGQWGRSLVVRHEAGEKCDEFLWFVFLVNCYWSVELKKNELFGADGMYVGKEKCEVNVKANLK